MDRLGAVREEQPSSVHACKPHQSFLNYFPLEIVSEHVQRVSKLDATELVGSGFDS